MDTVLFPVLGFYLRLLEFSYVSLLVQVLSFLLDTYLGVEFQSQKVYA